MAAYQKEIDDILTNRNRYHTVYYDVKTFGGPSLYFHRRALEISHG